MKTTAVTKNKILKEIKTHIHTKLISKLNKVNRIVLIKVWTRIAKIIIIALLSTVT